MRLWDDRGNLMVPTYTRKANGQQYRYYVSQRLVRGGDGEVGSVARISAGPVEELVEAEIRRRLPEGEGKRWDSLGPIDRVSRLRAMIAGVVVAADDVEIRLNDEGRKALAQSGSLRRGKDEPHSTIISVPVGLKISAGGKTIVSLDGSQPRPGRFDKALVRAVARANQWRELLESGVARTAHDLARHEGCRVSYIQRHMALAFLAPDIVEAIVEGRQSKSCALNDLINDTESRSWAGFRCR